MCLGNEKRVQRHKTPFKPISKKSGFRKESNSKKRKRLSCQMHKQDRDAADRARKLMDALKEEKRKAEVLEQKEWVTALKKLKQVTATSAASTSCTRKRKDRPHGLSGGSE